MVDLADLIFCSSGGLKQLLLPPAEQIATYPSITVAVRDILRDRAAAMGRTAPADPS